MTRTPAAVAGIVVLLLGLGVRAFTAGAFAKYAGVALYAVLVYVLVLVVAPRVRSLTAAVVAVGFCWAVEFFQLTPIPAELSDRSTVARLVLGSTFNAPDLLWYAVGIGLAALVHRSVVRRGGGGLLGVPRRGGAARS